MTSPNSESEKAGVEPVDGCRAVKSQFDFAAMADSFCAPPAPRDDAPSATLLVPAWDFEVGVPQRVAPSEVGAASPVPPGVRKTSNDRRVQRCMVPLCWMYFLGLLAVWLLLRVAGDRWWPTVPLVYGPRWIFGVPLIVLTPLCVLWKRRWPWQIVIATLVVIFPIMDFHLPWRMRSSVGGQRVRVLNCNLDATNVDSAAFLRLVDASQPDIIACQEYAAQRNEIADGLALRGWHIGTPSGRSLFLASRFPIVSERYYSAVDGGRNLAGFFVIQTPAGEIRFVNVHLETPRWGIEPLLDWKHPQPDFTRENLNHRRTESEEVAGQVAKLEKPILIAGDFNLVTDSAIFRDNWSQYQDGFASAGFGFGNTKFTQKWGVRIDHLLADDHWQISRCYVGGDVGSDHRPLITDLTLAK